MVRLLQPGKVEGPRHEVARARVGAREGLHGVKRAAVEFGRVVLVSGRRGVISGRGFGDGRTERGLVVGSEYLELGSWNFLSAARFQGRYCFFSSGLSSGTVRVDCSRSARSGGRGASAGCDDEHRIWVVVYGVGRAIWERGRRPAGLDKPRRLAMAGGLVWWDQLSVVGRSVSLES